MCKCWQLGHKALFVCLGCPEDDRPTEKFHQRSGGEDIKTNISDIAQVRLTWPAQVMFTFDVTEVDNRRLHENMNISMRL